MYIFRTSPHVSNLSIAIRTFLQKTTWAFSHSFKQIIFSKKITIQKMFALCFQTQFSFWILSTLEQTWRYSKSLNMRTCNCQSFTCRKMYLIDTWKDVCKEGNFDYPFRYQRVHICFGIIQYNVSFWNPCCNVCHINI